MISVYFFNNGNTAVFKNGEQVPELQGFNHSYDNMAFVNFARDKGYMEAIKIHGANQHSPRIYEKGETK